MGTARKAGQIKGLLKTLGWSNTTLAELVMEETNDEEGISLDKEEVKKRADIIKHQLNRPSTSTERLDLYLRLIFEHPDCQSLNLDKVITTHQSHGCINPQLTEKLRELSLDLDAEFDQPELAND